MSALEKLEIWKSKQEGLKYISINGGQCITEELAAEFLRIEKGIKEGSITITPLIFNDSSKFNDGDPRYGCDDCCDFDICWADNKSVEDARKARKIIDGIVAVYYG